MTERNEALRLLSIDDVIDLVRGCPHDGGFDRELGPMGCNLNDACVCLGIVMGARGIVKDRLASSGGEQ